MKNKFYLVLFLATIIFIVGCSLHTKRYNKSVTYNEKHRPQFHFSPPKNWMNDPNGMVYFNGEYHLFYQYFPDGNTWGPMHWGHAISSDMVHWKNLPIALYPDDLGYIFSGSAVVDWKNTSGFGINNKPPLVCIYTYHSPELEKSGRIDFQTQGIAFSNDNGRSWTKYKDNPVLKNPGIRDFRDPKVIWHEESQSWIMTLAVKDKISFYTSPDLKTWKFESDFNPNWAAYGGVWECPDLFPLKTQDGKIKWILLVSINPGAPNGGSGTQYFVGNFDGKNFTSETTSVKWIDHGADNYAGVTWSDIPEKDGRRLFIGWMSNWQYSQIVPTEIWRSAMTIPRELKLYHLNGKYHLHSNPVSELNQLRVSSKKIQSPKFDLNTDMIEIEMNVLENDFQIVFSNPNHESVILTKKGDEITFDRSKSGITAFNTDFKKLHKVFAQDIVIKNIRVFIDRSSLEFFFNDGEIVMTELVFPRLRYSKLETVGVSENMTIHELKSIW